MYFSQPKSPKYQEKTFRAVLKQDSRYLFNLTITSSCSQLGKVVNPLIGAWSSKHIQVPTLQPLKTQGSHHSLLSSHFWKFRQSTASNRKPLYVRNTVVYDITTLDKYTKFSVVFNSVPEGVVTSINYQKCYEGKYMRFLLCTKKKSHCVCSFLRENWH